MIIDAHYHLEERLETIDRLIDQMSRNKKDRVALIPTLSEPFHIEGLAETMSGVMRKALAGRLNKVGILMYLSTVTSSGKFSILGKTYDIYPKPDNGLVAQAIEAHPDKFFGWILVNPSVADPIAEMERWLDKPGWIGVKSHPFWHRYPVKILDDTAALCVEKGLPMLIHLGAGRKRGDYKYLPDRHSMLNVIYAHSGVPYYKRMWDYVKSKNNVFVDLSSPYLDEPLRIASVKYLGAQKCLYGTDGPFGYPGPDGLYDHGAILREIYRLPITDAEKEKILGINFKEIAGI